MCPECGSGGYHRFKSERLLNKVSLWDNGIAVWRYGRVQIWRKEIVQVFAFVINLKEAGNQITQSIVLFIVLVKTFIMTFILMGVRHERMPQKYQDCQGYEYMASCIHGFKGRFFQIDMRF